ncbi:MAG: hypothetical protein ABUR63_02680, partial [Verrucomicrobiota bacterium]
RIDVPAAGDGSGAPQALRLADGPPMGEARWLALAGLADVGLSSFTRKTLAVGLGQKRDTAALRP